MKIKTLASIDIGTNTFRLLIAEVGFDTASEKYSIREIHSERIITRLGEGIHDTGLLSQEAMDRSIASLRKFCQTIALHDVEGTAAYATSALREASNSQVFLDEARKITEVPLEIISGEEEARITAAGMLLDMTVPEAALMVDIGGGSTELILARNGTPELVESRSTGVVYLAGKFMKHDPPKQSELDEMNREVCDAVQSLKNTFMERIPEGTKFIGTAGTVTSLAAMCQNLTEFDHRKIHDYHLPLNRVQKIFTAISTMPSSTRARYIPFEVARLDIIVPGTLILSRLMEAFQFDALTVSNYGLREGMLLDLYSR